jgi:hypothetical protein
LSGELRFNAATGVLSGTPAAGTAGTYPITITASNGVLPNAPQNFTLVSASLSTVPSLNVTGLQATSVPTQYTNVGVALTAPTPTQLTGTLTLSFQSNVAGTTQGYIDPMTKFKTSGTTTLTFTIPVGAVQPSSQFDGTIQQGTTAGTITVTLTNLVAGTTNVVLPEPKPSGSVTVQRQAPVITLGSGKITDLSSTLFNVELDAYSTPRDLASATFTFQQASGAQLNGADQPISVSLDSAALTYFSLSPGSAGLEYGGQFHLKVPFTFNGDTNALGSVTVTLSNSVGLSS